MTLPRMLIVAAAMTLPASAHAHRVPAVTVVSSGALRDLNGAEVGRVSIEQQGGQVYLHVTGAAKAVGATLEVLVSDSQRSLIAGDHTGPGPQAVQAGLIERSEVRYRLPASVRPGSLRSVWIWCPSVRAASARATLTPKQFGSG